MIVLLVHPSSLPYTKIYVRLEPLGSLRIAQSLLTAGHQVHMLDLQVFRHRSYFDRLNELKPKAIGFSLNYFANVPEVIDLAIETKRISPDCFVFVGGHTATFIAQDLLRHAAGAIDCIVRGEGEVTTRKLLERIPDGKIHDLPGIVTIDGTGPPPPLISEGDLDLCRPARDLTSRRNSYFVGELEPCASIEFTRGCPWHCSFCSAWTFYNRTYRQASPEAIADELSTISEPNVFVLDDVAFIKPEHALAIGRQIEKRKIRKQYSMETRCDVLIQNQEIFAYWKKLGLKYLFLGVEAIDEESLKAFRKKISLHSNYHALEIARKLGITVSLNIIVDPQWDRSRFRALKEWAESVPEIVHISVMTPYPGTEVWDEGFKKLTTSDYRLFDIRHAVVPTRLPLLDFYQEMVKTQLVLYRKHMQKGNVYQALKIALRNLIRGRTNFAKTLLHFKSVHNPRRQYDDHFMEVKYAIQSPPPLQSETPTVEQSGHQLYVHSYPNARHIQGTKVCEHIESISLTQKQIP